MRRYPFEVKGSWTFFFIYIFQIFGLSMSACYNSSTDTLSPAMILLANAQIERLGLKWSKVNSLKNHKQSLENLYLDWSRHKR